MDEDKLKSFFNMLLNDFHLGNWKVELKFIDADEMRQITGSDTDYAATSYKDRIEYATIYLNNEAIYYDWDKPEYTLIHEFIHVMFHTVDEHVRDNLDKKELYTVLEERFINNMAYTMFNLFNEDISGYYATI